MQTPEVRQSSDHDDWSWVFSILHSRGFATPKLAQSTLLIAGREGFLLGNLTQKDTTFLSYLYVQDGSRRKGIGSSLVSAFVELSRKHHANQIMIPGSTGNAPGYLQPGVNTETETEALQLFFRHGFIEIGNVYSMQRALTDRIEIPTDRDWEICHPSSEDLESLADAITHSVPGEWNTVFKERFKLNPQQILIAKNHQIIGAYSAWLDGRFGPIGVRPEYRGKGLGRLLLAHSLERMREQGSGRAWFSWSDSENRKFYEGFGFSVTKSYKRLKLDL